MKDSAHSPITDKACLVSIISGGCAGLSAAFFRSIIESVPMLAVPANLQLLLILMLSLASGLVAVPIAKKQLTLRFHAPGEAGRLGIRAGLFCALWAGGVLTLLATMAA